MRPLSRWTGVFVLGIALISPRLGLAQTRTDAPPAEPSSPAPDYPTDRAGVLIEGANWAPINATAPTKTRTKGGVAQSLSYGAVRGQVLADYAGEHAAVQVKPGRVFICVCRLISIPGDPIIVKLHPQKGMRELDGGKLPMLGSKMAQAGKNDLVPVEVSHPDNTIWLVRSQEALPEGEYALMLGTQNVAVFPFTVSAASNESPNPAGGTH